MGRIENATVDIMLDSESSVFLLCQEVAWNATCRSCTGCNQNRLVMAEVENLQIVGHVKVTVRIGKIEKMHYFVHHRCNIGHSSCMD